MPGEAQMHALRSAIYLATEEGESGSDWADSVPWAFTAARSSWKGPMNYCSGSRTECMWKPAPENA